MALIVELLGPQGEVRFRRPLGDGPLTIGRGLDNDVVLDDPYADVRHARVVRGEDGAPVVEDLGSRNGLSGPDGGRVTRIAVGRDVEVRVGRTRLRFRDPDAPMPPALPDQGPERLRVPAWLTRPWGQLALGAIAGSWAGWSAWSESYRGSGASDAIQTALGMVLLLFVWAGIWAAVGRMAVHRARFLAHLALVSGIVVVLAAEGWVAGWANFLFPDNHVSPPVGAVIGLALIAVLLAGHLGLASRLSTRRRWVTGAAAGAAVLLIAWATTLPKRHEFSDIPSFNATLKAVPGSLVPTHGLQSLRDVGLDLRREVDALRATRETVRDRSDDDTP